MDEIVGIGADAAQNAQHELDEQRPRDQPAVTEMRQRIEVADVVALELEARAAALAQSFKHALHVGEGVLEDGVAGGFEEFRLPFMLPFPWLVEHWKQREIHRAHVERAHFGLGPERGRQSLVQRHQRGAAGGDVDHR